MSAITLRITEIEEAIADDALLALSKLRDMLVRRDANLAAFVATCEANARAIAAVPDLIGAAIAVKAIRPANWDDGDDPEQAAAWRQLDAAIVKAIGGAA